MIVLVYFYNKMDILSKMIKDHYAKERVRILNTECFAVRCMTCMLFFQSKKSRPESDALTRSLLLSLSVCYHARLQDRSDYETGVAAEFKSPLILPGRAKQFRNEIRW